MSRQLKKWYAVTVIISFCSSAVAWGSPSDVGYTQGAVAGQMAVGAYGSQSSSNQRISQPMTAAGTQMLTVDGSKSFSGNMSSPSSNKFLQVLIQPGGTGDLTFVKIMQDLDMDGNIDYQYQSPFPVSGICANGVISCSPGTWNDCKWYEWVSDSNHAVSLSQIQGVVQQGTGGGGTIASLGGCYCINSFCGSNLSWTNSAALLKDLGGGAVSSINTRDARVMITNVATDPVLITYFGNIVTSGTQSQSNPGVSSVANNSTVATQQQYLRNPGLLESYKDSVITTYGQDQDSFYYKVSNSIASNTGAAQKKCVITRNGSINTTPVASYTSNGSGSICVDHWLYMMVEKVDGATYKLKLVDTGPGGLGAMHHNCGDNPGGDGWHLQHTISLPPETATFQAKLTKAYYQIYNIQGAGCNAGASVGFDAVAQGFDTAVQATAPCPAGGAQTPTYNWSYLFEYSSDEFQESINDECAAIDSDPACQPQDVKVDGVEVLRNFAPTGLSQMPSCRDFVGTADTMVVCRSWWKQERKYMCAVTPPDTSAVATRYGTVVSSVTDGGSKITFTDNRKIAGSWVSGGNEFELGIARPQPDGCEKSCKIGKQNQANDQVTATSIQSTLLVTPSTNLTSVRACVDSTCPVLPGEFIEEPCACLGSVGDFAKAATIMQSMRLAGGDQMCSSGTAK